MTPQKVAIVTGANTGMGYETAKALALDGYQVVLGCRSLASAQDASQRIQEACTHAKANGKAHPMVLNLASLAQVRQFADAFSVAFAQIDTLICNAGVMNPPYQLTEDGFEQQFQVNYLGHFLLIRLLLERFYPTRIIQISSLSSEKGVANSVSAFEQVAHISADAYVPMTAYRESKLAQTILNAELHRRYAQHGLCASAVHPGIVNTDLFYRRMSPITKALIQPFVWLGYATGRLKTPASGAKTAIFLARETIEGGFYWADCAKRPANPITNDSALGSALWEQSEKWVQAFLN